MRLRLHYCKPLHPDEAVASYAGYCDITIRASLPKAGEPAVFRPEGEAWVFPACRDECAASLSHFSLTDGKRWVVGELDMAINVAVDLNGGRPVEPRIGKLTLKPDAKVGDGNFDPRGHIRFIRWAA